MHGKFTVQKQGCRAKVFSSLQNAVSFDSIDLDEDDAASIPQEVVLVDDAIESSDADCDSDTSESAPIDYKYCGKKATDSNVPVKIENAGSLALGKASALPLKWAVIRPLSAEEQASTSKCTSEANPKKTKRGGTTGIPAAKRERTAQRLRALSRRGPTGPSGENAAMNSNTSLAKSSSEVCSSPGLVGRFRERATAMLCEALRGWEHADLIGKAITEAFIKEHGAAAARRYLLDLCASLRRNATLREEVMVAGVTGAAKLARQDPREWATDELQAKRCRWAQESLREIKPAGPSAICPACGGRAIVATGTAGSGRAGRTTKAFNHYSCLEPHCGKSSHVKQD